MKVGPMCALSNGTRNGTRSRSRSFLPEPGNNNCEQYFALQIQIQIQIQILTDPRNLVAPPALPHSVPLPCYICYMIHFHSITLPCYISFAHLQYFTFARHELDFLCLVTNTKIKWFCYLQSFLLSCENKIEKSILRIFSGALFSTDPKCLICFSSTFV